MPSSSIGERVSAVTHEKQSLIIPMSNQNRPLRPKLFEEQTLTWFLNSHMDLKLAYIFCRNAQLFSERNSVTENNAVSIIQE